MYKLHDKMDKKCRKKNETKHSIVEDVPWLHKEWEENFPSVTNGLLKLHKILYIAFSFQLHLSSVQDITIIVCNLIVGFKFFLFILNLKTNAKDL